MLAIFSDHFFHKSANCKGGEGTAEAEGSRCAEEEEIQYFCQAINTL
jgi:hypothetical protein